MSLLTDVFSPRQTIKSEDGKWMLAMSSLMLSASQFVKREGFEEDALSFLESKSCHGLVVMGSVVGKAENNEVCIFKFAIKLEMCYFHVYKKNPLPVFTGKV